MTKLAHVNIRSLLPKIIDLEHIILSNNIDILTVSETWLNTDINTTSVDINGFRFIRRDRRGRGGGVGVYVRDQIKTAIIEVGGDIEQLWLNVQINTYKFIIGVVYRPPNLDYKLFLNELEDSYATCIAVSDVVYCCGDFNIDMLKIDSPSTVYFNNFLNSINVHQLIDQPTRLTINSSSLIDLILTTDITMVAGAGVISCDVSDHDLVFCSILTNTGHIEPLVRSYRSFNGMDYAYFYFDLQLIPMQFIFTLNDINDKISFLNNSLIDLFDKHAPLITKRFTKRYAPWITENLKFLMKIRDEAKARYRKSPSVVHWDYYKTLRNLTNSTVKREKKAYFDFVSRSNSNRSLWKHLEFLELNKKRKTNIPEHLADVNLINNFFIDSIQKPNLTFSHNTKTNSNTPNLFKFSTVSENEITVIISSIKTPAMGADNINIKMINLCCPYIIPYITDIINFGIENNVVPNCWKQAIVIPTPKCDQPSQLKDLRPISILPTMSKVFERVLQKQIVDFINKNSVLPPVQSGFRRGFSCETALLNVTDDIISATDRGLITILILLDFSKAFDTVDYNVLAFILYEVGFSDSAVDIILHFLKDRYQSVRLKSELSLPRIVSQGVPQGSILGPLLFSIYTHKLSKTIKHCRSHIYADDTQLYYSFRPQDWKQAVAYLNSDLQGICQFSRSHNLQINSEKSQVLLFGRSKICDELSNVIDIKIDNNNLSIVHKAKNLGVIIDNTFRYRDQISKYIKNAYLQLKKLYPYRSVLNTNIKLKLVEAFVLSQFTYCAALYHPAIDCVTANRIQKIQNSCLRFAYGIRKYDHISHTLAESGWLNMRNRRELQSLCLFHRILTFETPPYLLNKITFRSDVHNITTRFRGLISPPAHKMSLYTRSFTFSIYSKYNSLPNSFKSLSPGLFKKKVKEYIFRS